MKKICLITYTGSPNYGAALQLFATYQTLCDMDCDVSVINYQNQFESEKRGIKFLLSNVGMKEKAREYVSSYVFGVKKNAHNNFDSFYKLMKYTKRIKSVDEMGNLGDFDVFCIGSDQVWNPKITDGFDDVYILNTAIVGKRISYASSMGSCDVSEYSSEIFIRSLENFDLISVREKLALEYLQKRMNKPIKKVIDPTFLISKQGWEKHVKSTKIAKTIKEKYVLIYALGGDFENNKVVAQIVANKIGAKVYAITLSNRNKGIDRIISNATPFDFVSLIQNASFVVTNSFHGTCFSLMMNTPFYSVRFGANPARAEELLSLCKLEKRLYLPGDRIKEELLNNSDILNAQEIIKSYVDESREWLKRAVYE